MTTFAIGRPSFLALEEVLYLHTLVVGEHGGADGVRDMGLLESALAMPRQGFSGQFVHSYPFGMAAAYAFHVVKNHPFIDGNKRAALMCCGSFLQMNDFDLSSQMVEAADQVLRLIAGETTKDEFATWLQQNCRERPRWELRDFLTTISLADLESHFRSVENQPKEGTWESVWEAAGNIPLVQELLNRRDEMSRQGSEEGVRVYSVMFGMLTTLYRLAEDQGYEW